MNKEPFLRTVKRAEMSRRQAFILRILALFLAIIAGGIFLFFIGYNPFTVYYTIVYGAFRSSMSIQATVKIIVPLLISSLGVTLAFKMRFWNIGAEGQIIMGAIFASYFALFHSNWPHVILMIVMFLAGIVGGGLWGLIPTIFKVKYNTNETLFTLMLNYIALYLIVFLRDGPWWDPDSPGFAKIATFAKNAQLDKVFGVHVGWIIGLFLVVILFIYMQFSKQGYEVSVVGESQATASYGGMNVKKIMIRTMFLSGGICGIAGMVQAAGSDTTLATGVAGGVGFTAIIVAWLGRLNPVGILIISTLFGVLEKGSSVIESSMGISADCSDVLQGIIIFFVLGCEFFVRYKFVKRSKKAGE